MEAGVEKYVMIYSICVSVLPTFFVGGADGALRLYDV